VSYHVRSMLNEDIFQVTEIDRAVFPAFWPPINYGNELKNQLAYYFVACKDEETSERSEVGDNKVRGFLALITRVRRFFDHNRVTVNKLLPAKHNIIGFVGFWLMAGEAHVMNIAVRESYRRQGVGELLLISIIDRAVELKAQVVTLEVRVSNIAARTLYSNYGFVEMGLRRGYYENKEDGVVMTIDITRSQFHERFQRLTQAYSKKWGVALNQQIIRNLPGQPGGG